MLQEINSLRQNNRSLRKRWFHGCDMDLFVWFRDGEPVRFQLSYDKQTNEKMLSWDYHRGFAHYQVDDGESTPGHFKMTPLLLAEKQVFCLPALARQFLAQSENLQPSLADFIYARLMELPPSPGSGNATGKGQFVAS